MNPIDLIPWACSIGASILILTLPVTILVAGITLARGK